MNIFISFAKEQKEIADKLATTLNSQGHKVLYVIKNFPNASSDLDRVRKAIEKAQLFIFLVSPESIKKGSSTLSELSIARHRWRTPKDKVMAIMASSVELSTLPQFLQTLDVIKPAGELVSEVTNTLYFKYKRKKRITIASTIIAGIVLISLIITTIKFSMDVSIEEPIIDVSKIDIQPEFEILSHDLSTGTIGNELKFELVNKRLQSNTEYYCQIKFEDKHKNIKAIEYNKTCKSIIVKTFNRPFVDESGKAYKPNAWGNGLEKVFLSVYSTNTDKLIWENNIPIVLINSSIEAGLELIGLTPNKRTVLENNMMNEFIVKPYIENNFYISLNGEQLSDEYECELIFNGGPEKIIIKKKASPCKFTTLLVMTKPMSVCKNGSDVIMLDISDPNLDLYKLHKSNKIDLTNLKCDIEMITLDQEEGLKTGGKIPDSPFENGRIIVDIKVTHKLSGWGAIAKKILIIPDW